ncbi:MAG TPA: methyltransferase domain-containing protein [Candidatus Scybalomonas excrementigallinarum]|nr:methyltransferase domain-containing protein [Candidatus Scybalomonas excrementigallinarum]
MDKKQLLKKWLEEEKTAHIKGWDFSHIHDRYEEENDLPWDYKDIIKKYLREEFCLLDMDTGGGEFLLSLEHPPKKTSAIEAYAPNVEFCKETLIPLGIDFKEADGNDILPFEDEKFHIVINRHGDYNPEEISRVLKSGGVFITEQVGAENDRELVKLLLQDVPEIPFPEQYLNIAVKKFEKNGFSIIEAQEAFRPIKFWDVGALVWFAHIIEWEFPNFTVKNSLENLFGAQEMLEKEGVIEGTIHRFLFVAKKK